MKELVLLFVLQVTGIDCLNPNYLCSVVEAEDATHISICAFPTLRMGMFSPMPWKNWEFENHTVWIQTTNCTIS